MGRITAVFWDVGGVVLSNGWDTHARLAACQKFALDCPEFEARHESLVDYLELGKMTLDDYLEQAVFYRPRDFGKDAFKAFMYSQSQAHVEVLPILERLAASRRYLMATLNNESRELHRYRVERFQLRNYFEVCFTSCYLGTRKPDPVMYRMALDISQRSPEECLMIDDREPNLAPARDLGMGTIHFENPKQLDNELQRRLPLVKEAA
jgi:putative hydrolase of the HAD superfamily